MNQTAADRTADPFWVQTEPLNLPLLLTSLSEQRHACLQLTFCFMQKLPGPEGTDLQFDFDPIMTLLFVSASSFSLLKSLLKMLQIRLKAVRSSEEGW